MNRFGNVTGQRGIALVVVLWLLMLLTVVAASHARIVRTETRLAANHVEASKARSLAEAAAYHAILELLVRDEVQRWPIDGNTTRINYREGYVDISIRDTRGLVDLNHVQAALLDTVLQGADVGEQQRMALVDAILDWRDKDNLKHLNGAEDDDYRHAGLHWTVRDGPFSSVEELRYVLGMNDRLYERLVPYLTVHSGQAAVFPDLAPPWLARLLTGRTTEPTAGMTGLRSRGPNFRVTVQATGKGGATASLDMVVHIAPGDKQPYAILAWRSPSLAVTNPAPERQEDAASD